MVSATTRQQVWDQLIDAWHYERYFSDLYDGLAKWNRVRIVAHGLVAAGVSASLLGFLPAWAALPGNIIVVVFSVYSIVHDYSQDLATVRSVSESCGQFKTKVRALWADVQNSAIETEEASRRWYELEQEVDRIMVKAPPTKKKLSTAAEVAAVGIVEESYSHVSQKSG
jgi:hypothetical protein